MSSLQPERPQQATCTPSTTFYVRDVLPASLFTVSGLVRFSLYPLDRCYLVHISTMELSICMNILRSKNISWGQLVQLCIT